MDTFDLTANADQIRPEWAFDSLFLVVGPCLLVFAVLLLKTKRGASEFGDRMRRLGWFLAPFSVIWMIFTAYMSAQDIRHAYLVRSLVQQKRYFTLEGCLERFRAGLPNPGKTVAGNERWVIEGHEFSYGANEIRFAYHAVEPLDGIVHPDSWIRVSFVPDEALGRDDIIRLESKRHACPRAVHMGSQG